MNNLIDHLPQDVLKSGRLMRFPVLVGTFLTREIFVKLQNVCRRRVACCSTAAVAATAERCAILAKFFFGPNVRRCTLRF